ncbi:MAG: hypothetical protein QM783_17530 [Phycisphaerales bacterium]
MPPPPFLETRELGRMPLVTFGPGSHYYEYVRVSPRGPQYTLTFMVRPPNTLIADPTALAADVERFWRQLWSSLDRLAELGEPLVIEQMHKVAESGEALPDARALLAADRLYVIEYDATPGLPAPCRLTFNAHELECREILSVKTTADLHPVVVQFDG